MSWSFGKFAFRLFGDKRPYSLACLNIAQFLSALNDNMFKLILVFMVIDVAGQEKAGIILAAAGAVFVIPFILFSSMAGVLADRFSKQKLLVAMKIVEMSIMFLALFAFAFKSVWAGYTLLFLLATHSALFGPSKYGIIPEIVHTDHVSKANGLITGFTYLAIIFGTFFASFITEITDRSFVLTAAFCLLMSIIGFISTFGIKRTLSQDSEKEVSPYFVREIYRTLCFCKTKKHLLASIFGSSYFLFVGSFTQLNIIPYAIDSLHLKDIFGGYLFLSTALGIAIGSYIGGRASKKQVELGLTCLAGIVLSFLFLLLGLFSTHLILVIILLVLLGIFGGIFIVPCDTFTQITSPQNKRGQIIAAVNFLSFCGVFLAALALYFFSNVLGLAPATGFALIGICTFIVSVFMIARLSDLAFPYLAKKLVLFLRVQIRNIELLDEHPSAILYFRKPSLKKCMILFDLIPNLQLFIPIKRFKNKIDLLNRLFYSVHFVLEKETIEERKRRAQRFMRENLKPCFLISERETTSIFKKDKHPVILVEVALTPGRPTSVSFSQLKDLQN